MSMEASRDSHLPQAGEKSYLFTEQKAYWFTLCPRKTIREAHLEGTYQNCGRQMSKTKRTIRFLKGLLCHASVPTINQMGFIQK